MLAKNLKIEVRIVLAREPEVNLQHNMVVCLSTAVWVAEGDVVHSAYV